MDDWTAPCLLVVPVGELYPREGVVQVVLDDGGAGVDQLRVGDHAELFDLNKHQ